MKIENHLHTYKESRLIMFPSGELGVALAIHSTSDAMKALEIDLGDDLKVGISFIEPMGYLIYHPELAGGMTICWTSLDLLEDLGEL